MSVAIISNIVSRTLAVTTTKSSAMQRRIESDKRAIDVESRPPKCLWNSVTQQWLHV
jgi:hypothetical protein